MGIDDLHLHLSVSATTRAPRAKERDGVDYHFWTREHFDAEVRAGAFLEWAEVWGKCYGTLRSEVEPYRERGEGVVLDIDVQGAAQVRRRCPDAVTVFLRTSSLDEYERRLRKRHTEDEPSIQRRLAGARAELAHAGEYDHQVINDDLEAAVADLRAIVAGLFRPQTKEK
jgi:guanylate kinase